jgi:hypothetical protein
VRGLFFIMAIKHTIESLKKRDFKYLSVIEEIEPIISKSGTTHRMVLCQCKCGKTTVVRVELIAREGNSSCGCHRKEFYTRPREKGKTNKTRNLPEYHTWRTMKDRCLNPNNHNYKGYGGRGITVSSEWAESFDRFLLDMGKRPSDKHSLDRIDNEKGYNKENCRWADTYQQSTNKRNNRFFEFNGQSMCLQEWSRKIGISQTSLWRRFNKGWSVEKALTTPVRQQQNSKKITPQYDLRTGELLPVQF